MAALLKISATTFFVEFSPEFGTSELREWFPKVRYPLQQQNSNQKWELISGFYSQKKWKYNQAVILTRQLSKESTVRQFSFKCLFGCPEYLRKCGVLSFFCILGLDELISHVYLSTTPTLASSALLSKMFAQGYHSPKARIYKTPYWVALTPPRANFGTSLQLLVHKAELFGFVTSCTTKFGKAAIFCCCRHWHMIHVSGIHWWRSRATICCGATQHIALWGRRILQNSFIMRLR